MQPPSGGCVLKLPLDALSQSYLSQPPSGGCVLKQEQSITCLKPFMAAAFGRLCVETTGKRERDL